MKRKDLFLFIIINIATLIIVFKNSLWGQSLLAPTDIAPAFFPQYKYVDPNSSGIPANHFIIDQLTYDLAPQYLIYKSLHNREIPWWDPYTYSGRPLLAEAHINGNDPVRLLCYNILPFELAYNWTLILHSFLCGLSMFCLLKYLKFNNIISIILALTYEYSGCFAYFFGHPWIQASFAYYPFLWIIWSQGIAKNCWLYSALSSIIISAILLSGNIQSHSYLILFTIAFGFGYIITFQNKWKHIIIIMFTSILSGICLASPVLLSQIELFFLSTRHINASFNWLNCFMGVASLSAVFPWCMGTYRTIDIGYIIGSNSLGFQIFIGSVSFILAILATVIKSTTNLPLKASKITSITLLGMYLFICSTPLVRIFYTRSAGLAVTGLIILAGIGCVNIKEYGAKLKKIGWLIFLFFTLLLLCINITVFFIYPKLIPSVKGKVLKSNLNNPISYTQKLREFQVENLSQEISVKNPETIFAYLSICLLSFIFISTNYRKNETYIYLLLILNIIPVILFYQRFIPNHPVKQFHKILSGEEQQKVAQLINNYRLLENASDRSDFLYPGNFCDLYKVHSIYGYTGLTPLNLAGSFSQTIWEKFVDYKYESLSPGKSRGNLSRIITIGLSRFRWDGNLVRSIKITRESLNSITLEIESGREGLLIRTDTYYPGWKAYIDSKAVKIETLPPCFCKIKIPDSRCIVTYEYRPRFLYVGCSISLLALIINIILIFASFYWK